MNDYDVYLSQILDGIKEENETHWKDITGKINYIPDMDTKYLINVKKYIKSKVFEIIYSEKNKTKRKELLQNSKETILKYYPCYKNILKELKKRKIDYILEDKL